MYNTLLNSRRLVKNELPFTECYSKNKWIFSDINNVISKRNCLAHQSSDVFQHAKNWDEDTLYFFIYDKGKQIPKAYKFSDLRKEVGDIMKINDKLSEFIELAKLN